MKFGRSLLPLATVFLAFGLNTGRADSNSQSWTDYGVGPISQEQSSQLLVDRKRGSVSPSGDIRCCAIPEPSSLPLLAIGLGITGVLLIARKRART